MGAYSIGKESGTSTSGHSPTTATLERKEFIVMESGGLGGLKR